MLDATYRHVQVVMENEINKVNKEKSLMIYTEHMNKVKNHNNKVNNKFKQTLSNTIQLKFRYDLIFCLI